MQKTAVEVEPFLDRSLSQHVGVGRKNSDVTSYVTLAYCLVISELFLAKISLNGRVRF